MDDTPPQAISKPWGHEEIWAVTDTYVGKLLFVRAGHRLSLQHHEVKEETLRVMSGLMHADVGPTPGELTQLVLRPGDRLHLPPRTVHRFSAVEDTVLLEVSTTELDDVVRHADDYGRAGQRTDAT